MGLFKSRFKVKKTAEGLILNDRNSDINDRRAAAEILADFYLEWQEKLANYKRLSRMPETEENVFFFSEQENEVVRCLSLLLVDFDYDDGEEYGKNLRKLIFSMKLPEYSGSKSAFSEGCEVLSRHLVELKELKETGMGIFPGNLSPEMAERLIREKAGLVVYDYLEDDFIGDETEVVEDFEEKNDFGEIDVGTFAIPKQLMV